MLEFLVTNLSNLLEKEAMEVSEESSTICVKIEENGGPILLFVKGLQVWIKHPESIWIPLDFYSCFDQLKML